MDIDVSAAEVPQHVADYIASHRALTLATASIAGVPHAATFFYVHDPDDGFAFLIWAWPESVTAQHVDANPTVAFTIDDVGDGWESARGVQGAGEAHPLLKPAEIHHAVDLFAEKFPGLLTDDPTNLSFFRLRPARLQFVDKGEDSQQAPTEFRRTVIFDVFRGLPAEEADALAGKLGHLRVDTGDVVVRQGAPADKFFIIIDGSVEVVRDDGGTQRVVADLGPGQFFGELAILRDMPRSATVRATEPSTLMTMDRDTFRALVAQSLGTTQDFDQIVRDRLGSLAPAS